MRACRLEMIVKESHHCAAASLQDADAATLSTDPAAAAVELLEAVPHIGEATAAEPLGTFFLSYRQVWEPFLLTSAHLPTHFHISPTLNFGTRSW